MCGLTTLTLPHSGVKLILLPSPIDTMYYCAMDNVPGCGIVERTDRFPGREEAPRDVRAVEGRIH
jgi:hypothetical protein